MSRSIAYPVALALAFVGLQMIAAPAAPAAEIMATGESKATGFAYPESVAYDPERRVLYVSEFVSELKPTQKDGKGRISKVSLYGNVLEQNFLPAFAGALNKPKGIWVQGDRLWTTDIDSVWVFDLESKQGRKVELPGIQFANDPTVVGNTLYVSDNRGDQVYSVQPADFLDSAVEPEVEKILEGRGVNPNGLYPASDESSLLMAGFAGKDDPRGLYVLPAGSDPILMSEPIGRLDGLYETEAGPLLATDWNSGSLFAWTSAGGMKKLADGFKGPADFAVAPQGDGLVAVVPDLVASELRFVRLKAGM